MRKQDLIRLCIQNLLRKKSRTLLTVLGVVIGGCSIVIMVSLGIGMKEAQDKLLAQLGDPTIITVTPPQGGRGKTKLDDAAVRRIPAGRRHGPLVLNFAARQFMPRLFLSALGKTTNFNGNFW